MAWLTVNNIKPYFGMNIATTVYDSELTELINACQQQIVEYIGKDLIATEYTIIFRGLNKKHFVISDYDVNSITSLSYRYNPNNAWILIDSDSYSYDEVDGVTIIYYVNGFLKNYEYKLIYNSGLELSSLPASILQILREMVIIKFHESSFANSGVDDKRLGISTKAMNRSGFSETQTYSDLWHTRWINQLKYYRKAVV